MDEKITLASPITGLEICVAEVFSCFRESKSIPMRQIISTDYETNESESLQESTSQISYQVTLVDITSAINRPCGCDARMGMTSYCFDKVPL